jgi:ubiquinone/menaquinone biosynthesis C-methylase UbiE
MGSAANSAANIFQVSDYDESYWDNYLKARPKYSEGGFYDKILTYHERHAGQYRVAHDVGTGPGQVAAVLSTHFETVVASDVNQTHLDVCKHRKGPRERNITFVLCPGEEISTHVPAASADAIFSGEALALMDTKKALDAFATILKQNCTLAVWYYGRPIFADPKCQHIYDKIVNVLFGSIIKGGSVKTEWKCTTDVMASWFDSVRFEESQWKDVERYKWNTHGKMTFYDKEACDFSFDITSAIGRKERVVQEPDAGMWAELWNVDEVRRFVHVNLPGFAAQGLLDHPAVTGLFEELEVAMGGKEAKHTIAWPVVLLLATKK